jgi:5'-nucleotidase
MENIVIINKEKLDRTIANIQKEGINSLHILSDFDRTLTKAFLNNNKVLGILANLRDSGYLSKDYKEKARELYAKYRPIEISTQIGFEEKNKKMKEWWINIYKLLVECGLTEKIIKDSVNDQIKNNKIELRDGLEEFLKILNDKKVPFIIMSATGIGNLAIEFLKEKKIFHNNIHFIGNTLEFNKEGKFLGMEDHKIIHSLNKHETELKSLPIYKEIIKRKNVILLGDSVDDVRMVEGFNYENLVKIGFLNYPEEESLEEYKKFFDIIILNDGSFEYIDSILKRIIG